MVRPLFIAICALALSGCGVQRAWYDNPAQHAYQAGAIFLGADIISLANTGKTVDDHIIGWINNADCNTVRASQGGYWCIPNQPPVATVAQTEYCYKSLASASCFTQPVYSDQNRFTGSDTRQVPAP